MCADCLQSQYVAPFVHHEKIKNKNMELLFLSDALAWSVGMRGGANGGWGVARYRARLKFIGGCDGVGRGSPAPAGGES